MIVDFHTHVFPDGIAQKASGNIAKFYDMPTRYDGTLSTLLKIGAEAGVDRYVVHSVATTPNQTAAINDFVGGICRAHPGVYGFATIHPDQSDMAGEIERALDLGLKGVKIHPDMQRVRLDDPRLMAMYELIQGRFPLLAHTGDHRYDYSNPGRLLRVLDAFPRLTVIGAHFGGWSVWERSRPGASRARYLRGLLEQHVCADAGRDAHADPRLWRGARAVRQRLPDVGAGPGTRSLARGGSERERNGTDPA